MTATALRRALCVVGLVLALLLPGIGLTHAHAHGSADHCAICKSLHAPVVPARAPRVMPPTTWLPAPPVTTRPSRPAALPRPSSRGPPRSVPST